MIEKLLANPYAGDGTLHPDLHLIYVDEVCGLFKLPDLPEDDVKKKVFPLSLKGKALTYTGTRGAIQTVFNPFPRWHLEPSPSEYGR